MDEAKNTSKHSNVVINISGMSCNHCARRVEDGLKKVPGVVEAQVSFNEKKAIIKYSAEQVDLDKLKEAIKDSGYEIVE